MQWKNDIPWNGLGVEVSGKLSPREMVYLLKLDFETSRVPSGRPKSFANQETFQFFKAFSEHGGAALETIGILDRGRILWGLAGLPDAFTVKETDPMKSYLLLASRNETRDRIEVHFMALRPAASVLHPVTSKARTSFKNICRKPFTAQFPFMSHDTSKFDDSMIKKTQEAVGLGREAIAAFAADAERLADKTVDDATAHRYMFDVFQPDAVKEMSEIGSREIEKVADKKTRTAIEAIHNAPGQDREPAHKTAWGLLNAVTYAIDHRLGSNADSRLRLGWFGPHAKIKQRAYELALALL